MATITKEDVQYIESLPELEARSKLQDCLGWEESSEGLDMRQSIHLDFLYQNLTYTSEKGFTAAQTALVVNFAESLLEHLKDSQGLTDVLSFYNFKSMELVDVLGERNFKVYTEYVFGTVLPHYKLYQMVFTCDREEQVPHLKLKVEPPVPPEALKNSKEHRVWDYEKQVENLQEKEEERKRVKESEKENKRIKLEGRSKETLQQVEILEAPMSKESIASIVQDVLKTYSAVTMENLKDRLENTREELEYKLEVTSLPRPQALGPPPRFNFKAKTPVPVPKSPKPDSRGSKRSTGSGKGKKK